MTDQINTKETQLTAVNTTGQNSFMKVNVTQGNIFNYPANQNDKSSRSQPAGPDNFNNQLTTIQPFQHLTHRIQDNIENPLKL